MSKRVRFAEESVVPQKLTKYDQEPSTSKIVSSAPGARFKENHSIDSDDEDERNSNTEEEFEKLTEEDVEGAENEEICEDFSVEGGPIITPFNLKEEMTEGSFDKDGHYHFKKDTEIRDNWLDNIDWVNVKKMSKSEQSSMNVDEDDSNKEVFNESKIIEGIVQLLHKGETVTKGLRRLGGSNSKKKKQRTWEREKVYDLQADDNTDSQTEKNEGEAKRKEQFLQLTELADQMAGAGHYDIYTDTFEKLQHKLNSLQMSEQKRRPQINENTDADDALDMFADNIDSKEISKPSTEGGANEQSSKDDENSTTKWEYKWSEKESEVFGPFTSSQMAQWKEQGYFKKEVQVRRTNQPNSTFYNATRIDFDLYD